jgi:MFS family permease
LSSRLIHLLALAGVAIAIGVAAWALRRRGRLRALGDAAGVATPFLAPLLVIGGAAVVAFIARRWGFPIRGPGGLLGPLEENLNEEYGRIANEDYSAYGPVGIVALLAAGAITLRAYAARRVDARHLVLACALPVFLILVSLTAVWVPFLIRYFLIPAVIAAPLLARLFRTRGTTAAYLVVAAISIGVTIAHDQPKPFNNPYGFGRPWNLTQVTALATNSDAYIGAALADYDRLVPAHACVGAVIDTNEPSYLLFGPKLEHHVVFLSSNDTVRTALDKGLFYVVITTGVDRPVADRFREAGWRIRPLAGYWLLASERRAGDGSCRY